MVITPPHFKKIKKMKNYLQYKQKSQENKKTLQKNPIEHFLDFLEITGGGVMAVTPFGIIRHIKYNIHLTLKGKYKIPMLTKI